MAGTPVYVRANGRPDSEEAACIAALNALVDTMDTIRTRVNADAEIESADITAFKVLYTTG